MARYLPVKFSFKEERYQFIAPPKRQFTISEIKSFVDGDFEIVMLLSGDRMIQNKLSNEAARQENKNDIASSICGKGVFGPVLILHLEEKIVP